MPLTHLVIIGDRAALSWALTEQRMAFPAKRAALTRTLEQGDGALLYTTQECFGNPAGDQGRIIASATVTSPAYALEEPVRFGDQSLTEAVGLRIHGLTALRGGVVLDDLVPDLAAFPDQRSWSVRLRRPVLALPSSDARLLLRALEPLLRPYAETVDDYRWDAPSL